MSEETKIITDKNLICMVSTIESNNFDVILHRQDAGCEAACV
jgi:hypothetical protein